MEREDEAVVVDDGGSYPETNGAGGDTTYSNGHPGETLEGALVAPAVPEPAPDQAPTQPTDPDLIGPLTPEKVKRLRGKYFTVRHPQMANCDHKLDMINEPRHRNCENCWFQWLNTHPDLVETTDQFYRTQGKGALVAMRGRHYTEMFMRYMSTVAHFMQEQETKNEDQERGHEGTAPDSGVTPVVEGPKV